MTVSGLPDDDGLAALEPPARPDIAGLPPWADELPGPEPGTLPPWEAGPWPSHESPNHEPDGPGPAPAAGASGAAGAASGPDWAAAPRPGAGPWTGSAPAGGGAAGAGSRAGGSLADDGAAGAAPGAGPQPGASSGTGPAGSAPWGASPAADPGRWAAPAADTMLDAFPPARSPDPAGLAAAPVLAPDGQRGRPGWPVQDARPARDPGTGPATAGPARAGPAMGNPLATAALVAGIFGIAVLPGVILGVLGLRRASATGTGRLPSWLGIALSLLWAAGIIILALPGAGAAADPGCARYRATGSAAVARVTAALAARAPAARLHAELAPAGAAVNGAAAAAQSIEVRNTLGALGGALQSEQAAAPAGRLAPAALGPVLARAAAAARQLCGASS